MPGTGLRTFRVGERLERWLGGDGILQEWVYTRGVRHNADGVRGQWGNKVNYLVCTVCSLQT